MRTPVSGHPPTAVMKTTQIISGYPDLDVGPAIAGATTVVGRVWAAEKPGLSITPETLKVVALEGTDGFWDIAVENPLTVNESFDVAVHYQGKAVL